LKLTVRMSPFFVALLQGKAWILLTFCAAKEVVKARVRNDSKQDTMFTAYVNNC